MSTVRPVGMDDGPGRVCMVQAVQGMGGLMFGGKGKGGGNGGGNEPAPPPEPKGPCPNGGQHVPVRRGHNWVCGRCGEVLGVAD